MKREPTQFNKKNTTIPKLDLLFPQKETRLDLLLRKCNYKTFMYCTKAVYNGHKAHIIAIKAAELHNMNELKNSITLCKELLQNQVNK